MKTDYNLKTVELGVARDSINILVNIVKTQDTIMGHLISINEVKDTIIDSKNSIIDQKDLQIDNIKKQRNGAVGLNIFLFLFMIIVL